MSLAVEAECARSNAGCQDVDEGEGAGHETKAEPHHIGQDVLVGEDLSLLVLSQLLQIGISLVEEEVDQEPEHLLEDDGEHQPNRDLILNIILKCFSLTQINYVTVKLPTIFHNIEDRSRH